MRSVCATTAVIALGFATGGCKCASDAPARATAPSAVPSAVPLHALAQSVASAAAAQRKRPSELVPPPLKPPAGAQPGPSGIRYEVVQLGKGESLAESSSVQADFSVWTQAGALAFTTYQLAGPAGFSAATVPGPLFDVLRHIPSGSRAWVWLPAEFVHTVATSHVTFPYPDTALVLEYEPVLVTARAGGHVLAPAAEASSNPDTPALPPPDSAGPPPSALVTPSGLRYVLLRAGSGSMKPTEADKLHLRLTLWPIVGLVVGQPVLDAQPSATTLARAPAGLGAVLKTLTEGAVARVWLPAGKAQLVAPFDPQREGVLDLTLEKLE